MRMTLGELRRVIREAWDESVPEPDPRYVEVDALIDALPAFESEYLRPGTSVATADVFRRPPVDVVFGMKKSHMRLAVRTKLAVDLLVPTQEFLLRNGLKRYARQRPAELPLIVKYNGTHYVQDHTRIAVQILQGASTVEVRLIEYTDDVREPYRRPLLP